MKLQKVIALCKKAKAMRLFDRLMDAEYTDNGTLEEGCAPINLQYLSDGCAIYPLEGLPELNFDTLFTLYDISDADAEKISFNRSAFPAGWIYAMWWRESYSCKNENCDCCRRGRFAALSDQLWHGVY